MYCGNTDHGGVLQNICYGEKCIERNRTSLKALNYRTCTKVNATKLSK